MRLTTKCLIAAIGFVVTSACASGPRVIGGAAGLQVLPASELPAPRGRDFVLPSNPSILGPTDVVEVTVVGVEWLTAREYRIDPNGDISFPLVGVVAAAGLTPRQLEELLTERLAADQMVAPQVSVNIKELQSRFITVEGQVQDPGVYPVNGRISLLQAVALGGGTSEFSNLDDVVVFRTVEGQRFAALYDLDAIRHGAYADPDIYPNDIIMVGDERGRRLFKDIISIVPLFTSPLVIAIDRFAN